MIEKVVATKGPPFFISAALFFLGENIQNRWAPPGRAFRISRSRANLAHNYLTGPKFCVCSDPHDRGGKSLTAALETRATTDDILIGDTPKAIRRRGRLKGVAVAGRSWKHSTLADIDGLVDRAWIAQAFRVTLVRNPWDWMVAQSRHLLDRI